MNSQVMARPNLAPLDELKLKISKLLNDFGDELNEFPSVCSSPVVQIAMANGLPARLSYSIKETALITGLSIQQIYYAKENGDLKFYIPEGRERGARILTSEIERWFFKECE